MFSESEDKAETRGDPSPSHCINPLTVQPHRAAPEAGLKDTLKPALGVLSGPASPSLGPDLQGYTVRVSVTR